MLTCVKKALHKSQATEYIWSVDLTEAFIICLGLAQHASVLLCIGFIWIKAIRLIDDINISFRCCFSCFRRWAKKTRYITNTVFHLPFFPFPSLDEVNLLYDAHTSVVSLPADLRISVYLCKCAEFNFSFVKIHRINWGACAVRDALDVEFWLFQSNFQHWSTQNAYLIWLCLSKALLSICVCVLLFIAQTLQLPLPLLLLVLSLFTAKLLFFSSETISSKGCILFDFDKFQ